MAMTAQLLATCIFMAAQTYSVPPDVLISIMHVEGGRVGQQVKNKNASYDLGPMQINTLWLPELAKFWRVNTSTAWQWVRDDGCINVGVGAWILRQKINEAGSLYKGIAHYHSATPNLGAPYQRKVLGVLKKFKNNTAMPPSANITKAARAQVNTKIGREAVKKVAADGGIPAGVLKPDTVPQSSGAKVLHVKPVRKSWNVAQQMPVPKPLKTQLIKARPIPKPALETGEADAGALKSYTIRVAKNPG